MLIKITVATEPPVFEVRTLDGELVLATENIADFEAFCALHPDEFE